MWTIVRKDLLLWVRVPQSVLVTTLLPLVVLLVAVLAGTIGQHLSLAVVKEQSTAVVAAIERSPYIHSLPMDRPRAESLVSDGMVSAMVDSSIGVEDAGRRDHRPVHVVMTEGGRGDEDLDRNLTLRVIDVVLDLNQRRFTAEGLSRVEVREEGLLREMVSDMAYLATGIIVFTALFGGLANTALLTAREWDERIVKETLVSPRTYTEFVLAKIGAGSLETALSVVMVFAVVMLAMGIRPIGSLLVISGLLLAVILTAASLGVLLGTAVRRIVPAVMASVVLSILAWFIGGGFGPVSFAPDELQWVAWKLPSTYAITATHQLMHMEAARDVLRDILLVVIAAVLMVTACSAACVRLLARRPVGNERD